MANLTQPEEFQRALSEGAWLLRHNRPGEALERLLPLYELAPSNPDVAINLGGAYILQGKWNKAERILVRAAELHPDNAMVWMNLGAAHLGRLELAGPKQQARAMRAYERVIALDPSTPNAYYNLGLIHKDRGEIDRATTSFQRAVEVNPADADARYWLDWLAHQTLPAVTAGAPGAPRPDANASASMGGGA